MTVRDRGPSQERRAAVAGERVVRSNRARCGRGFTIIDILVSVAIVAILISLLLPSLSSVNETARRVACRSNIRQVGLALTMYASSNQGQLPMSVFRIIPNVQNTGNQPQNMLTLKLAPDRPKPTPTWSPWDGLGLLYSGDFLSAPKIFFCPSHRGNHPYSRYAEGWDSSRDEIVGNYHYRGLGPRGIDVQGRPYSWTSVLDQIEPSATALIADGIRTRSDVNHRHGANLFRADLSAAWFSDPSGRLLGTLPATIDAANGSQADQAWGLLDGPVASDPR